MSQRLFTGFLLMNLCGCLGPRYTLTCESDTSQPISVTVMASREGGEPRQLFYTELTGNDTRFEWDRRVDDKDAHVEVWFHLRDRPGRRTVYALPPDKKVWLKLDRKDDAVVVEETQINGKKRDRSEQKRHD